jgi:Rieske Fe-S protein
MERERSSSRRSFLHRFLISWLLLVSLPGIYAVIQYLIPPKLRERLLESILIAKTQDIPSDGVKRVKFNKKPVYLFRNAEGQVKALSGVCTHLGCVVEYHGEQRNFVCNCHGSTFSLEGKNLSGPAPRPLESFRVELKGDDITIFTIKS